MRSLLLLTCLFPALAGCEQSVPAPVEAHEDLDAAAWIHTSAEYQAIAEGTYRTAREKLLAALADPTWSAIPAQQDQLQNGAAEASKLPPAVIVDVDETVLNNLGFQARMIEFDREYNLEDWHAWVDEASASLIPGAGEFIRACAEQNVTIFFVTNRRAEVERGTRRNLEAVSVLSFSEPDTILSKYERDEWTTDKTSRRAFVAGRYRVLLLIGDDLNDFVWVDDTPTAAARRAMASEHATLWGHKWFMLPNPNYGGWERALYGFEDALPRSEKLRHKLESLPAAPEEEAQTGA